MIRSIYTTISRNTEITTEYRLCVVDGIPYLPNYVWQWDGQGVGILSTHQCPIYHIIHYDGPQCEDRSGVG